MSSVVLSGDTSGTVTLTVPAVAGTNTVTLPAQTGNVMLVGSSFAAYLSGPTTTITNMTATKIVCDTVDFNIGGGYNATTGLFTAPVAGRYLFTGSLYVYSVQTAEILIFKNGSAFKRNPNVNVGSNVNPNTAQTSYIMNLAANDTVGIYVYQTSGGTATLYGTSQRETSFTGQYLGV